MAGLGILNSNDRYTTTDGIDLNQIWSDFNATLKVRNGEKDKLIDFLTFGVTKPVEQVTATEDDQFELASEFGIPKATRTSHSTQTLGFSLGTYDKATRYTWQYLAQAPRQEIDALHNATLAADKTTIFRVVFSALFSNENRMANINGQNVNVYSFYNGDGTVPPVSAGRTFDGNHSHYLVSGATEVDPGDLNDMLEHIEHHGYSLANGNTTVLLCNRAEAQKIQLFRSNVNGATYDFVPASGTPAFLMPKDMDVFGGQVASQYQGLNVKGTYGPVMVIENDFIPAGHMAMFATGGQASLSNPIGLREPENASVRGLQLIEGPRPNYPLIESYYVRQIGSGVRHRGAAVVMQIKASGTYEPPAQYSKIL